MTSLPLPLHKPHIFIHLSMNRPQCVCLSLASLKVVTRFINESCKVFGGYNRTILDAMLVARVEKDQLAQFPWEGRKFVGGLACSA
jgi:hypothetical protein